VLADVRFVYDKVAVLGKAMKDAPCILQVVFAVKVECM